MKILRLFWQMGGTKAGTSDIPAGQELSQGSPHSVRG